MKRKSLMKKVFVSFFLFVSCLLNAQNTGDSVVMTVAGKPVALGEFMFIAGKNNEVNFSDNKSIESYTNLFKNFKLKVAEAEALGLDTLEAFQSELARYRSQLKKDYLSDKKAEEKAARTIYNRQKEVLDVSHILFSLPEKTLTKDTLLVFEEAMAAYHRLQNGADFESLGRSLAKENGKHVAFQQIPSLFPLQMAKQFENVAYATPVGEFSKPIRTPFGYHILKVNSRKPNLYSLQIAHIFRGFLQPDSIVRSEADILAAMEPAYQRAKKGEDFASLVQEYSDEEAKANDGLFPYFGVNEMIKPIDEASFALNIGDVSRPIKSPYGYHIIKLIDKKELPSFDQEKEQIIETMGKSDHNFELFHAFDERLKKEYGYVLYPDAYEELLQLCDAYFPSDNEFFEKGKNLDKTLITVNGVDYPQKEFVYYINRYPISAKTYSGDFMREVFDLFVRDIVTGLEEKNLEVKQANFNYLMKEYRDGMLLFEISNQKIWNHPIAEQEALDRQWIAELTAKYPVVINKKLLKQMKTKR